MWYLCCQEGKAGGMEAERGRKQAGRGEKKNRRQRVRNRGREGKKIDFERDHKMMWHHSVPVKQNHLHPSSHRQNNGRIYHAFAIHGEDFSNGEDMKEELKLKFNSIAWKYYCWATHHKNILFKFPLLGWKTVCLGAMMKMSTSKVFFFFRTKTLSSSESEVGTDARQDGLSVVSVSVCMLCLRICMCGAHSFFLSVLHSLVKTCLFSPDSELHEILAVHRLVTGADCVRCRRHKQARVQPQRRAPLSTQRLHKESLVVLSC